MYSFSVVSGLSDRLTLCLYKCKQVIKLFLFVIYFELCSVFGCFCFYGETAEARLILLNLLANSYKA